MRLIKYSEYVKSIIEQLSELKLSFKQFSIKLLGIVVLQLILVHKTSANLYANEDSLLIKNGSFNEYVLWKDTRGEIINAHDGGVIIVDGTYYWYGLALRPLGESKDENHGAATTTGINLYSSKNLHDWKFETVILPASSIISDPLRAPMRMERPKIIYNKKTNKYVMWFHYVGFPGLHGQDIGFADAGVAVADKITGPFKFLGHQRPINDSGAVKDCTLFMDNDTAAYFIYDRKIVNGTRCLHIVKLTDDFLSSTNQWTKIDVATRREAPVVIKHKGVYFLVTSDVSGWKANAAKVFKANNIMGPWKEVGNPCVGEGLESTYNTQSTYAFTMKDNSDLSIMMLERHNRENFMLCSYVWLPINITTNEELYFPYRKEWSLLSIDKSKN